MAEEEPKVLLRVKEKRKYERTKATRACSRLHDDEINSLSRAACAEEVSKLQSILEKLKAFDENISDIIFDHHGAGLQFEEELENCDRYSDCLSSRIHKLKDHQHQINLVTTHGNHRADSTNFINSHLKLPQLPLPRYAHNKGEDLNLFFTNFESIVDRYKLGEYETFMLLMNQLSGEPLTLIKSLQGSQQQYTEAKSLLQDAFADPLTQKFDAIKRLTQLRLPLHGSAIDWISEMRLTLHLFATLEIDIQTVQQYFVWHSLNADFQNQLIAMTNSNRPTLHDIQQNMFKANERYTKVLDEKTFISQYESTVELAATVNLEKPSRNKFTPCCLCTNNSAKLVDHPIHKCTRYEDASKKVTRLREMNRCIKCGNGHSSKDCEFNFYKKCVDCGRAHFSYLCLTSFKASSKDAEREKVSTGTIAVPYEVLHNSTGTATLLPTFTAHMPSGVQIRSLKDSGSQCSFIDVSIAQKERFTVNRKIKMAVNGFNSTQEYDTVVVNAKIRVGNTTFEVPAICVPGINTSLNLSGVNKVAAEFIKKGFPLLDETLVNCQGAVTDFKFILGSDVAHLIPEHTIVFGDKEKSSAYSITPHGVLLYGNLSNLKGNVEKLPQITSGKYKVLYDSATGSDWGKEQSAARTCATASLPPRRHTEEAAPSHGNSARTAPAAAHLHAAVDPRHADTQESTSEQVESALCQCVCLRTSHDITNEVSVPEVLVTDDTKLETVLSSSSFGLTVEPADKPVRTLRSRKHLESEDVEMIDLTEQIVAMKKNLDNSPSNGCSSRDELTGKRLRKITISDLSMLSKTQDSSGECNDALGTSESKKENDLKGQCKSPPFVEEFKDAKDVLPSTPVKGRNTRRSSLSAAVASPAPRTRRNSLSLALPAKTPVRRSATAPLTDPIKSPSPDSLDSSSALPEPSTPSASPFKRRTKRLGALQSRAKTRTRLKGDSI